jgi:transcriptional regulator with XRE-family HTH domain
MSKGFDFDEKQRRQELADFLRKRRARISPLTVGLPESARKRTPGLRREDVAELADLSLSWYSWLEQARPINVSDESLNAIADALQLNKDERNHLFHLAKPNSGSKSSGNGRSNNFDLTEINRLVNGFAPDYPVTVLGRYMNLLIWNKAAGELCDDFRILPKERMNWAWFVFKYQPKKFFDDWEIFARCALAKVRGDYGKYLGSDAEGKQLVEELRGENPIFDEWWSDHEVLSVPHPHKKFNHPTFGKLQYLVSELNLESQPEARIVVFAPLVG